MVVVTAFVLAVVVVFVLVVVLATVLVAVPAFHRGQGCHIEGSVGMPVAPGAAKLVVSGAVTPSTGS
ncbi:MAG: hypothetical protein IIU76_00995 [Bacteroidales bacterium]|nr:hypothetical protein [Bacteroidales bacterium]